MNSSASLDRTEEGVPSSDWLKIYDIQFTEEG